MTDSNGRYKEADYTAEHQTIYNSNTETSGNTRDLIRMMKRWQAYCSVPIKSFWIEIMAVAFLKQWHYSGNSATYYDWMCRDFLSYMIDRVNIYIYAPGTYEMMYVGNAWESKAKTALERAKSACAFEVNNGLQAGEE